MTEINENNNNSLDKSVNDYYYLIQKYEEKNSKTQNFEDLLNNPDQNDNSKEIFLFDKKLEEERENRLNEKDKMYKFKKHYFLKDSYQNLLDAEKKKQYEEIELDMKFEALSLKVENKLRNKMHLNMFDLDNLVQRNYWIFNSDDRMRKKRIQQYYYTMCFGSGLAFLAFCSFVNASFSFLNLKFKSKFRMYFTNGVLSFLFLSSNLLLIRLSWNDKLQKIVKRYEKEILDPDNYYLKIPRGKTERDFKPFIIYYLI